MDGSLIYSSGVLKKGEDILNIYDGAMERANYDLVKGGLIKGSIVLTNRRFLFVERPKMFSKGVNVIVSCNLDDIMSISTKGLVPKRLTINMQTTGLVTTWKFSISNTNNASSDIKNAKNNLEESLVLVAKNVIIEGGNKEKAEEILQKRLARGEISLDEFHRIVQRL